MTRLNRFSILALAVTTFTVPAMAEVDAKTAPLTETAVVENPASTEVAFETAPLTEAALMAQAGREDIALVAKSDSTATVTRNNIGDNSKTGDIRVADQAFQNLSGLSILNVNSGNNVAINASMNVNISITPDQ